MIPKEGSEKEAEYGARGALGGVQTVPRAELRAIHHCLLSIKDHATIKHVTIYSDCKMAVDGFKQGRQHTSRTQLGQLWSLILDEFESCEQHGMIIEVIEVKSHETEIHIVPRELRICPRCADYHPCREGSHRVPN